MPEPTIKNGEEHFFPIVYEGNGAGQRVGNFIPFTDQATIANSCLFNDGDLPRLYRQISAGNRKTYTISLWFKLGKSPSTDGAGFWSTSPSNDSGYGGNPSPYNMQFLQFASGAIEIQDYNASGNHYLMRKRTTRTFEDTSKWYHFLMAVDTTQDTESDRMKMYIDGDLVTSFNDINSSFGYPDKDEDTSANQNTYYDVINIGYNQHWDGYIAEFNFVDGQALLPASFGITDTSTGRWIPKTVEPFPTTTTDIAVTVVSSGGNKYALDGVTQDTVTLIEGATYKFDQSDSSNSGHPLRFSTTSDGTHGSGSEYTTGVTTVGTPGSSGAYTQITVATGAPTLYYYCSSHSGMGGTANTQDQYGTNGYRLKFQDSSALGDDTSGNGNDFTSTNLATTDQTTDSPTQNHATINPNTASNSSMSFAEGNLNVEMNNAYPGNVLGTLGASSGKYYWEVTLSGTGSSANGYATGVGVAEWSKLNSDPGSTTSPFSSYIDSRGYYFHNGTNISSSTTFTAGDVISIALNLDDSEISYYKNNSIVGSAQPLVEGQTYFPLFKNSTSVADLRYTPNFGQKSWNYTPPTGFVALQQDNLPETAKGIVGLTWIKDRDNAYSGGLRDSSRGRHKDVFSNLTQAEVTNTDGVQKFLKGGIQIEDLTGLNASGASIVSWNWVANGGTTASNTNGSITSTVQANTTAGFSIVEYTGTGSAGTVGHGLSSAPEWVMSKSRSNDTGDGFTTYHTGLTSASYYVDLSKTNAQASASVVWNGTAPTSSVFSIGTATGTNTSSATYIAYCWHSVEGFSKFGSYTGTTSSDGPFIYTGFTPSWVMIKRISSTGEWFILDKARNPNNTGTKGYLDADTSDAEGTLDAGALDWLSNGFKLRQNSSQINNGTHIYMAFAEHPFIGDGTNPVTAI